LKILKIFENVPRVPPLHIFRNFELLELVIVVVVEGEGDAHQREYILIDTKIVKIGYPQAELGHNSVDIL